MSVAPKKDSANAVETLGVSEIMDLLPHRHPCLMIDRLEEIDGEERAVGVKNVTHTEPWYQGHFPDFPVMPGVLIIEAMGQTAAALVTHNRSIDMDKEVIYFMGIDRARFRAPVVPGDQLRIEVVRMHSRGSVWRFKSTARVNDTVVAEAEYVAMHYKKDQAKK